jgi:CBS domain containing-hemolysin-like protein
MLLDRKTSYSVSENDRTIGIVSLDDVRGVTRDEMGTRTVGDVVGDTVRVPVGRDAFGVLMEMNQAGVNTAIVEEDGETVGVVTRSELGSVLDIRKTVRVAQ